MPRHTIIRVVAYGLCLVGLCWLTVASVHFRQSIRSALNDAYSRLDRVTPTNATDAGKILNSYYEDVYRRLPDVFWPAGMVMVGSTILFLFPGAKKTPGV